MKKKGVSPVVATVILVAVAITVAVGVAYYMGTVAEQYLEDKNVTADYELGQSGDITITTTTITIGTSKNVTTTEILILKECDIYMGDDGAGWLVSFNGTHIIHQRFVLSDETIVFGGN